MHKRQPTTSDAGRRDKKRGEIKLTGKKKKENVRGKKKKKGALKIGLPGTSRLAEKEKKRKTVGGHKEREWRKRGTKTTKRREKGQRWTGTPGVKEKRRTVFGGRDWKHAKVTEHGQ